MAETVHCIARHPCSLGESPVWLEETQVLYWLDIAVPSTLFEWSYRSGATRTWALQELASALTLSEAGDLIVLSQSGVNSFDTSLGRLRRLAPPPFGTPQVRFNDCGCDRSGRLWTGTMPNNFAQSAAGDYAESDGDKAGDICRFDADLSCHVMAGGFGCPNTFAWSPDGSTFYTADSAALCIYSYRFDLASGAINDRRIFADPSELGVPDGSAMDREGYLWNARWGAGCLVRFAPDGSVAGIVTIPASLVTSCAFGGEGLDTLFVTTARCEEPDLQSKPLAGGVFAFKPPVAGMPQARFRMSN